LSSTRGSADLRTATPPDAQARRSWSFAVIVGVGVLDLGLDLVDPALMSSPSPPPSTMVVSSLVMMTFLAEPSRSSVTFSA
jgi:hypothetical protein